MRSTLDRFFEISRRGSTLSAEIRGGLATFFTMAYILAVNPNILGHGDASGHYLTGQLVPKVAGGASVPLTAETAKIAASTALVALATTLLMGIVGRVPIALAAGLGVNAIVAFQLAPRMSWPAAMGIVVIQGVGITVLVLTGVRRMIFDAVPAALKHAITCGIGLFIAFIGFVDAGFAQRTPNPGGPPVQLGPTGNLLGWPVVVFVIGLLAIGILMARRVKGAILIGIIATTVVAMIINKAADVPAAAWGGAIPAWPKKVVAAPDFGLLGHFSIGGAFHQVGVITVIVFAFTIMLSDFFDAMGTMHGVSEQAGILDEHDQVPRADAVLLVDSVASFGGGLAASSSATCYIESAAGVGEGAKTGFASVVTALCFGLALFVTPLVGVIPSQATAPALVIVGLMMMSQVRHISFDDFAIALPAFLTMVVMPFTYSITDGIGAGFVAYAVLQAASGKAREVKPLMWITAFVFLVYFAIEPVKSWLGVG
ncbi:MAG TPA: NCS2 family permease [Acidimicrobiales bacterium]|jgi:AGZA family xanthine/uracil permease-like MFS transporter|nr:NCS2 family permease [Acidimicrobiales bacterium]